LDITAKSFQKKKNLILQIKKSKFVEMHTAMGAAKPLVKEITYYLGQLNTEQQTAVLGVVKTFAQEDAWWKDKDYLDEMDRRFDDMESGKVKSLSLDALETGARKAYKNSNRAKK